MMLITLSNTAISVSWGVAISTAETAAVHHAPQVQARHGGTNLVFGSARSNGHRLSTRLAAELGQLLGVPPTRVDRRAQIDEPAHVSRCHRLAPLPALRVR